MNAVDTNVFVYLVDVDEPAKRARANELMETQHRAGPSDRRWFGLVGGTGE